MLALLLLLSALNSSSSTPVPIIDGSSRPPIIVFGRELPECMNVARYRTLQDIVWSCLVTIFACTWVAVHPNLPGPYDSGWTRLKRKVTTMIYAMLTPELVMMWAMGQYLQAQRITKEFNKTWTGIKSPSWTTFKGSVKEWFRGPDRQNKSREWTITHGFFLQMGGFMLCDGETPISVLEFEQLKRLVDDGKVDLPKVTEEEISDKSKGDFLTKLFVVVQTLWFVFQCLARWVLHLPVTELEVVTLAFAILNVITCGLWWNKPLNVIVAISVPIKFGADQEPLPRVEERESWMIRKVRQGLREWGWIGVVSATPVLLLQGFLRPFAKLSQSNESNSKILPGSLRVPMFYINDSATSYLIGDTRHKSKADFPTLAIGFIFGALHLIPWSSKFPSTTELWLWRSSALIITVEPILFFLAAILERTLGTGNSLPRFLSIPINFLTISFGLVVIILSIFAIPLYLLARFTLLVLSFTTLRDLPPETYANIKWTTFIPHI